MSGRPMHIHVLSPDRPINIKIFFMAEHNLLGKAGEDAAVDYLERMTT